MPASAKFDRLLAAAVSQTRGLKRQQPIDVVVTPAKSTPLRDLLSLVESLGEGPARQQGEAVLCRLAVDKVAQLAESDLVSQVRLARLHQMH